MARLGTATQIDDHSAEYIAANAIDGTDTATFDRFAFDLLVCTSFSSFIFFFFCNLHFYFPVGKFI